MTDLTEHPPSHSPRRPRGLIRFLWEATLAMAGYVAFVAVGTVVFLLACEFAGYLPYSDRPGPGWHAKPPGLREAAFFGSWGLMLVPTLAIWAAGLFIVTRTIRKLGAPRWLIIVTGGLLGSYLAMISVAGIGWYIAIAAPPVYAAAFLGGLHGTLLLPRAAGGGAPSVRAGLRWVAIAGVLLLTMAGIYRLVIYRPYSQQIEIVFARLSDGENLEKATSLSESERALLRRLAPGRGLRFGATISSGVSGGPQAHALIVCAAPIASEVSLPQPKGAKIVYVQESDSSWRMYPPDAPTLSRKIRFGPVNPTGTAIRVLLDGFENRFTWYPPIPGRQ